MSAQIEQTIICPCGQEVDSEHVELARLFPKLIRIDQCASCATREADEERARKESIQKARQQSEREARLDTIPPEMLRTRINHPTFNPGLWMKVEGWQPSGLKWLGIVGGAGQCKTRCLALLAKRLILTGHRLTWTTAVEFQDRVDDMRGDRPEAKEASRYMSRCKSAGILVFDDIGKNTWTPAVERYLFGVIDHRKTHDLPVLWTSNLSPREILASGQLTPDRGAPLIGRLIEASTIEKA
jgi:hypothetical protein